MHGILWERVLDQLGPSWSKVRFLRRQNTAKRRPSWPSWSKLAFLDQLGPSWSRTPCPTVLPAPLAFATENRSDLRLRFWCSQLLTWSHKQGGHPQSGPQFKICVRSDKLQSYHWGQKDCLVIASVLCVRKKSPRGKATASSNESYLT